MPPTIPSDLKHQLRQCANCKKSESCGTACCPGSPNIRFRVCGKCKTHRYCSPECQRADWPSHKERCKVISAQLEIAKERDELATTWAISRQESASIPLNAIYPLLQDWTATYRPLMCLSLLNASGLCDGPPTPEARTKSPQIFFIDMSVAPGICSTTKARAAFLVNSAEVLSIANFRRACTDKSHRFYDPNNVQLMLDYDRHTSQMGQEPTRRVCMVVQKTYFHNGVSAMMYHKNWYFEDDCMSDYSTQWKPDDWLSHLKQTVARGKGWHRDDVQFLSTA